MTLNLTNPKTDTALNGNLINASDKLILSVAEALVVRRFLDFAARELVDTIAHMAKNSTPREFKEGKATAKLIIDYLKMQHDKIGTTMTKAKPVS